MSKKPSDAPPAGVVDIVPTADVQKQACHNENELRVLLGVSGDLHWSALCKAAVTEIEKLRGS